MKEYPWILLNIRNLWTRRDRNHNPERFRYVLTMAISRQTEEQILEILARFTDALHSGEPGSIVTLIDPDFSAVLPGAPVRYASPSEFIGNLPAPFALDRVVVRAEGTVAWVIARLFPEDPPERAGWFSAVLRGTGHTWVIAQIHLSLSD